MPELRAWLAENHDALERAWLVTWKKADPDRHVSYEELVRQLLCFGWIDSKAAGVDDQRTGLLIARRRPKSGWSRSNKVRVAGVIDAGLMQPAGLAAIDEAKASGAWTSLDDIENLIEPDDLRAGAGRQSSGARLLGRLPALGQAQHPGLGRRCQAGGDPDQADPRDGRTRRRQPSGTPELAVKALVPSVGRSRTLSGRPSEPTRFFRRRARKEDRVNCAICARRDEIRGRRRG